MKVESRATRWMAPLSMSVVLFFAVGRSFAQSAEDPSNEALTRMTLEELMELDVTSVSKRPEPYGQAPAAIQVITGDAIRRSGASSIPEALRLADNLHVAQKGSHNWAISARGFNTDSGNKLLVLVDGRSVYTPLFSGVFWDLHDYPLEDVDRIEVVSGPGGTLWGANAVNGVINIITKSAKDTQGLLVEGSAGSELRGAGSLRYGTRLASDVFLRVYGQYFDRDGMVYPDGRDAADAWRMGRGGFRMDAAPSASRSFTLQGDYFQGEEEIPTGGTSDVNGVHVLGGWSQAFSPQSGLRLQMYYDRTHMDLPVSATVTASGDTLAPPGKLVDDLDTFDVDFQHHFRIGGSHELVWGVGYRFTHEAVQSAPGLAFDAAVLDRHLVNVFVQDRITLARALYLTLGNKLEHNDYTGLEVEPNARLQWDLTPGRMLWAAVSRAIRAPSRVDTDIRLPTPNFSPIVDNILVGGENFQSESVIAYELGYRARLGSRVSGSVSAFYNEYDDVRSTSLSPPNEFGLPFPLFYENNLEGQTHGLEFNADYQVMNGWRLHGSYSFFRHHLSVKPGRTDFNNALNETADPENRASLRSSMDLTREVDLDAGLRWVDTFVHNLSGAPGSVPAYVELDVRLGWTPVPRLELSAVGQNLLHDQHLEYVIASPNPREEIERGYYGKLVWRF